MYIIHAILFLRGNARWMKVRGRERAANARKYEDGEATVGPARGYTARERVGSGAPVPDERSSHGCREVLTRHPQY